MAETVGELLVKIGADVGDLRAQLAQVGASLDGLAKKGLGAEQSFTKFGAATITLNQGLELAQKALQPIIRGLEEIAEFATESVAAAGREEEAQRRLAATLQASGQFTADYAEQLNTAADSLEALTGISSEAITEAQSLFVAFGATADQIEPLTRAAITLSKTFGGDLSDNARKLITDINGESDALSRLGIKHDETAGKAQRFADVLAFTSKLADPTRITGYSQQVSALSAAYDSVQKAIGGAIISTPEFQALLRAATEELTKLAAVVRENKDAIINWVGSGIELAIEALGVLETAAAEALRILELVNAFNPANLATTLEKLRTGASLTPIADSISTAATKTAEFQQRVADLAEEIRTAGATARSPAGIAAITTASEEAAAAARQIGPSFAGMGAEIVKAGSSTATALKAATAEATNMQGAFEAALDAGAAFGNTGGRLGPIFDEAGKRIALAGEAARLAFSTVGELGDTAVSKVAVLDESFDRTRAQAEKASDAIRNINQFIAGIRIDAETVGLSDFDQAVAQASQNVRRIGENARLSASEMETALSATADAVAEKFRALGAADIAQIIKNVDLEIKKLSFRGIDDELAVFLTHLAELHDQGKLSLDALATAAEEARVKFARLAGQRVLADVDKEIDKVRAATDLFGDSFADIGRAIELARDRMIQLRTAGESATPEFARLAETLRSLETEQTLKIDADISAAETALDTLRADILDGAPSWQITIDRVALERELASARERVQTLVEGSPARLKIEADITKLEEQLAALPEPIATRTLDIEPVVRPTATPAGATGGLGAQPFVRVLGEPASGPEIIATLREFQNELIKTIQSGTADQIAEITAQGRAYINAFEGSFKLLARLPQVTPLGLGVAQARQQLGALENVAAILRQIEFLQRGDRSIAALTSTFTSQFAGFMTQQVLTNALLRENNTLSANALTVAAENRQQAAVLQQISRNTAFTANNTIELALALNRFGATITTNTANLIRRTTGTL